jgi:hypothetical protein
MKSLVRSSMTLALLMTACGVCSAETQILKQEPPLGAPPGEKFLVDDGTCGRGKIKELTIPVWSWNGVGVGEPRQRRCIARR